MEITTGKKNKFPTGIFQPALGRHGVCKHPQNNPKPPFLLQKKTPLQIQNKENLPKQRVKEDLEMATTDIPLQA